MLLASRLGILGNLKVDHHQEILFAKILDASFLFHSKMSDVDSATIEAEVGTRLEQIRCVVFLAWALILDEFH